MSAARVSGQPHRAQWKTRTGFLLAAIGSAVGLGNIWRFSYICYENGGGAFILLYLVFIILIGIPALIATIMIGASQEPATWPFSAWSRRQSAGP